MKNIGSKYYLASLLFGIVIFLFWWLGFPQALNYQEQNQLFLFTGDYFRNDLSIADALADRLKEGPLYEFLDSRFPRSYKKRLPDGTINTVEVEY